MWKQALLCLLLRFGVEGKALSGSNETSRVGRSLLQTHSAPATRFRCKEQQFPGIFADVETGCQVFHFCESTGTNATFSCPNLTLFNQQYFVCDWSYNVRCELSEQFYSLNRDLYITPEKIISPVSALKPQPKSLYSNQPQLLDTPIDIKVSASEVSRTLSSLVSQLDSSSSSLVEDSILGDSLSSGYRPGNPDPSLSNPGSISNHGQGLVPEGDTAYGNPSTEPLPTVLPAPSTTSTSAGADPTSADSQLSPTYSSVNLSGYSQPQYDDVADPEPDPTYVYESLPTYVSEPLPTYVSEPLPTYVSEPLPTYVSEPLPTYVSDPAQSYGSDPAQSYGSDPAQSYGSDPDYSADPEPASYYAAQQNAYSSYGGQGSYDPYDAADPEPAAYYDSADPEPAAYYDSADPEPASYYAQTIDLSSNVDYDAVADPEPNSISYSPVINPAGASKPSGYRLFSTAGSNTNFYNGFSSNGFVVDSADPEPDPEFSPYS